MLSNDTCRCAGENCDQRESCARYRYRKHTSGHPQYVSWAASLREAGKPCEMHMALFPDEIEELEILDAERAEAEAQEG